MVATLLRQNPELYQPDYYRGWVPKTELGMRIFYALPHIPKELRPDLLACIQRSVIIESELHLTIVRASGELVPLGLVGRKVVTDVGVAFIVDAFQNLVELELLKFHGIGTGSTAEAVTDTALVTELTTEYTGNVRATGTTTEQSAAIYKTVATNTLDGTPGGALREHGIFDQAATGGGVLLDRTVFAAITLVSGDGLQTDYRLTLSAGG